MYAETGLMFPSFLQQFEEFNCSQKPNASLDMQSSLMNSSPMPEYNLWGEGDLFKAPEPILEELMINLDPISSAISMISSQPLTVSDIELSIESGQLLSDVFYECRKDLLDKDGNGNGMISLFEELNNADQKLQVMKTDENVISDENLAVEGPFAKSVSSSCLTSMDKVQDVLAPLRPSFLDFPAVDFASEYKMRRAFSEGDIKTLGNGNNITTGTTTLVQSPKGRSQITSEDRREKLSRYWNKKSKRNFGRKIKYACRKALADSQPRIRGRFAKTEDSEMISKNI